MFVVFYSKKTFFLKCLQHFFQVDMEPFIDKNIGIQSQRMGMDYGRENDKSKKLLSHANFIDFYFIVFFSKQWSKLDIFFKKSTNNCI